MVNRVDVITITVILAGLSWATRRARGPVAAGGLAWLVRTGGYAALLALVVVKAAVERAAYAPPNNLEGPTRAWTGEIVFLVVMTGYAAVILVFTARRSPAAPATIAIGTATGAVIGVLLFALGPLGFPLRFTGPWPAGLYDAAIAVGALLTLCAPLVAGLVATRRASRSLPARSRWQHGAMAGLCAGAAAALVVAVLSTATIALLPYDSVLQQWAAGHIGHWASVASSGESYYGYGQAPRLGYVAGNSAFASGYLIVLLLGPLFGCAFGAWAGRATGNPDPARPRLPGGSPPVPRPVPGSAAGSSPSFRPLRAFSLIRPSTSHRRRHLAAQGHTAQHATDRQGARTPPA
jgi:hypothetical protein